MTLTHIPDPLAPLRNAPRPLPIASMMKPMILCNKTEAAVFLTPGKTEHGSPVCGNAPRGTGRWPRCNSLGATLAREGQGISENYRRCSRRVTRGRDAPAQICSEIHTVC